MIYLQFVDAEKRNVDIFRPFIIFIQMKHFKIAACTTKQCEMEKAHLNFGFQSTIQLYFYNGFSLYHLSRSRVFVEVRIENEHTHISLKHQVPVDLNVEKMRLEKNPYHFI